MLQKLVKEVFIYLFVCLFYFFAKEESERVVHENKRSRLDDENEESSATTTINAKPEITVESPTAPGSTNNKRSRICDNTEESSAGVRTDHEPITIESPGPTPTRSQEDVTIVGDVQVASPEVIDLERLPTIRQGNCSWYRQWRVLTLLKPGKPTTLVKSLPRIRSYIRSHRIL